MVHLSTEDRKLIIYDFLTTLETYFFFVLEKHLYETKKDHMTSRLLIWGFKRTKQVKNDKVSDTLFPFFSPSQFHYTPIPSSSGIESQAKFRQTWFHINFKRYFHLQPKAVDIMLGCCKDVGICETWRRACECCATFSGKIL